MLGVTRLLPWFEQAVAAFEPVFTDSCNADSFKHLASTLILGEAQWTVSELSRGISRPDGSAKSRSAYDYFFSGADWLSADLAQYHAEYPYDLINQLTSTVNVPGKPVEQAARNGAYCAVLNESIQQGLERGVSGTPTVFVNDRQLTAPSAKKLSDAIEQARS